MVAFKHCLLLQVLPPFFNNRRFQSKLVNSMWLSINPCHILPGFSSIYFSLWWPAWEHVWWCTNTSAFYSWLICKAAGQRHIKNDQSRLCYEWLLHFKYLHQLMCTLDTQENTKRSSKSLKLTCWLISIYFRIIFHPWNSLQFNKDHFFLLDHVISLLSANSVKKAANARFI